VAVQQPWVCVLEGAQHMRGMHGGKVWDVVVGMALAAGFVLEAHDT